MSSERDDFPGFGACPTPVRRYERVVMGHGSGGTMSQDLLDQVFLPRLGGAGGALEDQAAVRAGGDHIAVTTDAFVVSPLFFPGGDIGSLAIHGTVNDLAVGGARPRYIAASFILEEGLELDELARIVVSMRRACDEAGVEFVTGDTKVVDRGRCDGAYITTTGIGVFPGPRTLSIAGARAGDRVLVSGSLGDHGMAIMSVREGLEFESPIVSDSAPLHELADVILRTSERVRCMRDPTRGGLSAALNELSVASRIGVSLDESALPVRPAVAAACEMLGFDPLYVANEGKLVAVVGPEDAEVVLGAMREHPLGRDAAIVGEIVADSEPMVTLRSSVGGERVVPRLAGEQLPRIC